MEIHVGNSCELCQAWLDGFKLLLIINKLSTFTRAIQFYIVLYLATCYLSRCLLYYVTLYRDRCTTCFLSYVINIIVSLKLVLEFYSFFIKGNITGLKSWRIHERNISVLFLGFNWLLLSLSISSSSKFKRDCKLQLKERLPF